MIDAPQPSLCADLDLRRDQIIHAARDLAESDGWAAVTMRRLAAKLGVTGTRTTRDLLAGRD